MYKLRALALALTLAATSIVAMNIPVRGRLSTAYHKTTDQLSNHKVKLGVAAGTIGTAVVLRVFNEEINEFVKPLIKKLWNRTTSWFKKVFTRSKKA